jgi:hypothetical protein
MRIVRNYHGSFRHPLRAFVFGMALIALTLVGFALAAGIATQNNADRIVVKRIDGTTRVVTHQQPVLTTVVSGSVQRITLPGSDGQVVVVRIRGKRTVRIVRVPLPQPKGSTSAGSTTVPLAAAAPNSGGVETVTETVYDPITVTEPGSTVTETVTESQSTSSSTTDTTATSSP